jgi:hypothetical protein
VFKSVKKEEVVDYSLGGEVPIRTNAGAEEPMLPPMVEETPKK